MMRGETVKNGDFSDSEEDAIDAIVLYFQSTSDFPSWTSGLRSRISVSMLLKDRVSESIFGQEGKFLIIIGQRRPCLLFDRDGRGILGSICGNKLSLGWSVANENALVAPRTLLKICWGSRTPERHRKA